MNCEWIKNKIDYSCLPLRGIKGENALEIGTPFTFPDGTSINFYILEQGENHILISDNGDTAMHISSCGNIWNQATPKQIEKLAEENHICVGELGDLRKVVKKSELSHGVATFVTALIVFSKWIEERINLPIQLNTLADEAEVYLASWKPKLPLQKDVTVRGRSKREFKFDFQQGNELIDVISASPSAVGAAMRKAGDVMGSPFAEGREIRVIVNDLGNQVRAQEEKQILGSMVKAMLFSELIRASGAQQPNENLELFRQHSSEWH